MTRKLLSILVTGLVIPIFFAAPTLATIGIRQSKMVGLKVASGKTNASLQGTYHYRQLGVEEFEDPDRTEVIVSGSINFNGSGAWTVADQEIFLSDGTSFNLSASGTYAMEDDGSFTLTVTSETPHHHWKGFLSNDNTLLVMTRGEEEGAGNAKQHLVVGIKAGAKTFSNADLNGTFPFGDFELHHENGKVCWGSLTFDGQGGLADGHSNCFRSDGSLESDAGDGPPVQEYTVNPDGSVEIPVPEIAPDVKLTGQLSADGETLILSLGYYDEWQQYVFQFLITAVKTDPQKAYDDSDLSGTYQSAMLKLFNLDSDQTSAQLINTDMTFDGNGSWTMSYDAFGSDGNTSSGTHAGVYKVAPDGSFTVTSTTYTLGGSWTGQVSSDGEMFVMTKGNAANSIRGLVTDTGGEPLQGIPVILNQDNDDPNNGGDDAWDWVGQVYTNENGYYQFTQLQARTYHLYIYDGVNIGERRFVGADLWNVVVFQGAATHNQDFTLPEAFLLYGYVRDTFGNPLGGQVVSSLRYAENSNDWHMAYLDQAGRYELWLPESPGAFYPVKVFGAYLGEKKYEVKFSPNLYKVEPGDNRGPDFFLSEAGSISGRVLAGGQGAFPMDVEGDFWKDGWSRVPDVWTNMGGNFQLDYYPQTDRAFVGPDEEQGVTINQVNYAIGEAMLGPFTVLPGQVTFIGQIHLLEAGQVIGLIEDPEGSPVPDAEVRIVGNDEYGYPFWLETETNSYGYYSYEFVPPGLVGVQAGRQGYLMTSSEELVTLNPRGTKIMDNLVLRPIDEGVYVSGRITNYTTLAPRDANEWLLPIQDDDSDYEEMGYPEINVLAFKHGSEIDWMNFVPEMYVLGEATVEDGYDDFFLPNGREGEYGLYVPAGLSDLWVLVSSAHQEGRTILVLDVHSIDETSGASVNLDFSLPESWGRLEGEIILPEGHAFRFEVDLVVAADQDGPGEALIPQGAIAQPMGDAYAFGQIPAGTYTITGVHQDLGKITYQNVQVEAGKTTTLDIDYTGAKCTVCSSAGPGGSVSPPGCVSVPVDESQTFTFTPDNDCYRVEQVLVDGNPEGAVTSYTFECDTPGDHTIEASFVPKACTFNASAGPGGTIAPSGQVNLLCGACQTFTMTPDEGYAVKQVTVGGMPVGAPDSYMVCCDGLDRTIYATFMDDSVPTVGISNPPDGSTINQVFVAGTASDQGSGLSKVELQITDGTHYLTQEQWWTTSPTWVTAAGTEVWQFNTILANWTTGTEYTVKARAFDKAENSSMLSSVGFTYEQGAGAKVYTTLFMDPASQSIENNATIDVPGKLTRLPDNGEDLTGLTITLTMTAPDDTVTAYTTTTNAYGHYQFEDVSGFTQKGGYELEATFDGTATLYGASSGVKTVMVGAVAGYAVIVEGKIENNEGLASHNKTANRIYERLKARNFSDDDIYYFNYDALQDGVDEEPTKDGSEEPFRLGIRKAIQEWARDKLNASPAPLWIIMVDHGNAEAFYVDEETITPSELDSWLDTLEAGLNTEAALEKRMVMVGACYSGSFIPGLSEEGRVMVTSAAEDEASYKGPEEPDGIRSGEFFLEALMETLQRGSSLTDSFETATETIETFTRKGAGSGTSRNRYFDDAMQHPLLDDDGNGEGSNVLSEGYGDGAVARNVYLGTGVTYDVNRDTNAAEVINVVGTQYLDAGTSSALLWAQANDDSKVLSAWMEVRSPTVVLSFQGETEQQDVNLIRESLSLSGDRWEETYDPFDQSGKWEVYYFVRDLETEAFSPAKRSVVYKDKSGNQAPSSFNLLSPDDGSEQKTVLILDWEDSTDPHGVTYNVIISKDADFGDEDIVYRQEEIGVSITFIDGSAGLEDGSTYYWKVEVVDGYGARTESNQNDPPAYWRFETNNTNAFPGFIRGRVYSTGSYAPIIGANVNTDAGVSAVSLEDGVYLMLVPAGTFTVSCSRSGYEAVSIPEVGVAPGGSAVVNFEMETACPSIKGDVNGDGNVDSGDAILILQYSVGLIDLNDCQLWAANVTCKEEDRDADSGDAIRILQYSVGLIDQLDC